MLTRIEVDGFKSLRNFSLDLEPCMAFVGTNSAGKSNILDALALLSRLVSMPVREALKGGRGHIRDQFSLGKNGHANKMTFAVELLLPNEVNLSSGERAKVEHTRVRYELELERRTDSLTQTEKTLAVRELILPLQPSKENPVLSVKNSPEIDRAAHIRLDELSWGYFQTFVQSRSLEESLSAQQLKSWMVVTATREAIQNAQFSQVEPSRLRGVSEAADATILARDGSNLPTVFAALSPETQARVRANFIRFVPGLRDVEAKKRDDEFYIEVTSQDGRRFPARTLSDGTLRILALLTLLYSSPAGSLIAVEELENGIYPGQFVALLEALQETTSPEIGLQLLLTSHSPTVISAFKDKPRSLVFVDMVSRAGERVTRARQIQEKPTDRGATSISRQEVESILESVQPGGTF